MSSEAGPPAPLSPSILARHKPATAIIEHDPEPSSNTYDFPNGLKHDLAIMWWCERNLQHPAGPRLLVTTTPTEGELKPEQCVVEVKCGLGWPLGPVFNLFLKKPKGRCGVLVRKWILKRELRLRSQGMTSLIIVPVEGGVADFVRQ